MTVLKTLHMICNFRLHQCM